jgi:hypothetical protein
MLKQDPALVDEEHYQELTNMVSVQEGNLAIRNGNQRLTAPGELNAGGIAHTIDRLVTSPGQSRRYVGQNDSILASNAALPASGAGMNFDTVATGCANPAAAYTAQRFESADFAAGSTGVPYKFLACPLRMLKDDGFSNPLALWGILPPLQPARASNTGSGTGPSPFVGLGTPYKYVYTFVNGLGSESNPSALMVVPGVTPNGHPIQVRIITQGDPQVQRIKVYRSGGSYADGLYRLLGKSITSPGPNVSFLFFDGSQDADIVDSPLAQFDNDPPVPSSINFQVQVASWVGGQTPAAINTATLVPPAGGINDITVGSPVTILGSAGTTEIAYLIGVNPGAQQVTLYTQLDYSSSAGVFMNGGTATGSPASIALTAFDSVFLAGDPKNPQSLYKSKNSQPESFPVIEQSTQIPQIINVGSPSDPIQALTEYGGGVLSLNLQSIYFISVFQGVMGIPAKAPAQHGLIARNAWCRVANEIWYLSYDGIYSYAGGAEQWKSEAIDPLFRNIQIGAYLPLDLRVGLGTTGADIVTMEYVDNEVFIVCNQVNGAVIRLRYHTKFERWSVEYTTDPLTPVVGAPIPITAQNAEQDTGNLLLVKATTSGSVLYLDNIGTSDGWVNAVTDGAAILMAAQPGTIAAPPGSDRLYSDFILECQNQDTIGINTFYDFGTFDPTDIFFVPADAPPGRRRKPFPFHGSNGFQAYAMSLRFTGSYVHAMTLYSLTVNYWDLALFRDGFSFDWDDLGYPYEKTLKNLTIEMDTGGIPASVQVQGDGVNIGSALLMTTTATDRKRTLTVSDGILARMVRLIITPAAGGFTKYFKHAFDFVKEPPTLTFFDTYPWEDLGYPYEKTLKNLQIEVDTGGVAATLQMFADGVIIGTFAVTTTGVDRVRTLTAPDNARARTVRFVLTAGVGGYIKHWSHKWDFVQEPPTLTFYDSYPWDDLGYPDEKVLRWLNLECDTGGVQATLQVFADGNLIFTLPITTTNVDRNRIVSLPLPSQEARMVRFLLTAGVGGFIKYFKHTWEFAKEPASITSFDSLQFNFEYDGYSFLKQAWIMYQCNSPITINFYSDNGALFYTLTLPSQPYPLRDVQRFYFPAVNAGVLNKSKRHQFTITSPSSGFKFYLDGSRLEWMPCGADQRGGYQQAAISEIMQPK